MRDEDSVNSTTLDDAPMYLALRVLAGIKDPVLVVEPHANRAHVACCRRVRGRCAEEHDLQERK